MPPDPLAFSMLRTMPMAKPSPYSLLLYMPQASEIL